MTDTPEQINGESILRDIESTAGSIYDILSIMRRIRCNVKEDTDTQLAWGNEVYNLLVKKLDESVRELKNCKFEMSNDGKEVALVRSKGGIE